MRPLTSRSSPGAVDSFRGLTQREKQALRDRGFTPAEIEFLNGLEEINQMVRGIVGNGQPQLWNAHCPPKARASELGRYSLS